MASVPLTAARALPPSARRRATTIVLVTGTVISLAAAFGPEWVVRLGTGVAIGAAIATAVLAWREVRTDRRAHAAAMLATTRAHGETLRIERSHNASVLQVVTDRNIAALAEITRQQTMVAQLRGEISALKGDRAALRAEVTRRESVICDLRHTVRAREAELAAALAVSGAESDDTAEDAADVRTMPRRVLAEESSNGHEINGHEINGHEINGRRRLVELDLTAPAYGVEPVLPNYEEDRRPA